MNPEGRDIEMLAERIWRAQREGGVVPAPSATLPGFDLEAAYAVQRALVARWVAEGEAPIGWKVGMASAIGRAPGAPGPLYGRVLSGMLAAEGEPILTDRLAEPQIEAEIAFVLDRPLRGPGVTVAGALAATRGVVAAFEILAGHLAAEGDRTLAEADFVADNGAGARVVLGGRLATDLSDLRLVGMMLTRGGELVATGAGARVLRHPAQSVAWLANALAKHELGLRAGEIVLSGSLAAPLPARPGDVFTAEFCGLGSVTARFA